MSDPQSILRELTQRALDEELMAQSGIAAVASMADWIGVAPTAEARGLEGVVQALIRTIDSDTRGVPVLVCGLLPKVFLAERVQRIGGRQLALWQWPGFAYLQYGFSEDQLIATARKVVKGAHMPLPPGLLPTVGDVLRVTSEVRHWLENRSRNTEGTLTDFQSAARGDVQLHPTHLEPVAAISEAHRKMLDSLWALDVPAERFAPRVGGLAATKAAIAEFEARWQILESVRAAIRATPAEGRPAFLAEAVKELDGVRRALATAIDATNRLDEEMMTREMR